MNRLTPLSEDFLYWDPEMLVEISRQCGPGDFWFVRVEQDTSTDNRQDDREVSHVAA